MDIVGLQKAIDKLNDETIPELRELLDGRVAKVIDDLHELLDRIDGTRLSAKIDIPPRGVAPQERK